MSSHNNKTSNIEYNNGGNVFTTSVFRLQQAIAL